MRAGFKLVAALVALAILALVALAMVRGVMSAARMGVTQGTSEPDPMFAEPEERVTRPPETDGEEAPVVSGDDDPSRDWVYETLTPVEQTASELAEEP